MDERLARYAEAINVNHPFLNRYSEDKVRAVVALADYEQAELRERLRALARLLMDEGHLTPMGKRQVDRVLAAPPEEF